ncbi:MAG: MBL fold metallo-hydrolase [Thermoplasmatota archaeon]
MDPTVDWLGHASFRITSDHGIVYIDPWKIESGPKGDIILVTHPHKDHLSIVDINKVRQENTWIVGPPDVVANFPKKIDLVPQYWKQIPVEDRTSHIKVEGHRAYNLKKNYHPISKGWLAYVVEIGGYRIYHSGDTDLIPEMEGVKNIDVALLAIGGKFTMDPKEAATAAAIIDPKLAIPMHWGDMIGTREDAEMFEKICPCDVEIPEVKPWWFTPHR